MSFLNQFLATLLTFLLPSLSLQEGSIGHDLVIKPLPHELSQNKEQAQHVVYKREAAATEDQLSDFGKKALRTWPDIEPHLVMGTLN